MEFWAHSTEFDQIRPINLYWVQFGHLRSNLVKYNQIRRDQQLHVYSNSVNFTQIWLNFFKCVQNANLSKFYQIWVIFSRVISFFRSFMNWTELMLKIVTYAGQILASLTMPKSLRRKRSRQNVWKTGSLLYTPCWEPNATYVTCHTD